MSLAGNGIVVGLVRPLKVAVPTPAAHVMTEWPWPFDLKVSACRSTAMDYMSTTFCVDSLNHLTLRARTDRQTGTRTLTHYRKSHLLTWLTVVLAIVLTVYVTFKMSMMMMMMIDECWPPAARLPRAWVSAAHNNERFSIGRPRPTCLQLVKTIRASQ